VILFLEKYQDIGSFFDSPGGTVSLVLNEDYLVSLPKYSVFEIILPGLIAFGIIVQPSLFAGLLCLEFHSDQRTFDRLMLASLPATQYVLGTLLIQVPVIIVQTIVLFVFSLLLGFNPLGNVFLGFFIALTVLPFAASLSYITAAFVSNEDVAGTILGFGSPIIGYASGAFTTLPHLVLIPDFFPAASGATRDFLIWDLLPLTHAVNALKNVLLYDFSLGQVFIDLSTNIILSLLMLVIAAVIFAKLRFRSP
ncbi:MAG: ABC transporter permease, partial [Candidatus Odinarchaeota archaeon]